MKRLIALAIIVFFKSVLITDSYAQRTNTYDIVVYGGTSAGVTAAVEAARMGQTVILISPQKHLGGLTSSGLGWTDIGNRKTIGGIAREFYTHIYEYYENKKAWQGQERNKYIQKIADSGHKVSGSMMWTFEPHVAEQLFDDLITKDDITVKRGQWLDRQDGVNVKNGHIVSITMRNGMQYNGDVFIDATYEGDLMASSGVSYTVGREANSKYGESINGIETALAKHHQFPRGVSPYQSEGDSTSGLLPEINHSVGGMDGEGDQKVQAYNYRICLTDNRENKISITRPAGYDSTRYALLLRLFDAQPKKRSLYDYFIWNPLPNRKTDINNFGAFSTDMIGSNYAFPEGSYDTRNKFIKKIKSYSKGLLYFFGHDPRVPKNMREQMLTWGYAKDEFEDTGYWPYKVYVREGRRMVSPFVMTENHVTGSESVPEPIALGSYTMDSHHVQRYITPKGDVQNEGDVEISIPGPYPISYKAMIPDERECTNLLVPVSLSASHMAYGSIRMEPVFMMLGQAAGTAAALAVQNNIKVQEVSYPQLKEKLLDDGQILSYPE